MSTKSIYFKSNTTTDISLVKENDFIHVISEDHSAIYYYTGLVSYIDDRNIGFKTATKTVHYKSNSVYVSKISSHFSIGREYVKSIEARQFNSYE